MGYGFGLALFDASDDYLNNPESYQAPTNADDGYAKLADAIVRTAIQEYVDALSGLYNPSNRERTKKLRALQIRKQEIEAFFNSPWFKVLSNLRPAVLMQGCNQIAVRSFQEVQNESNLA